MKKRRAGTQRTAALDRHADRVAALRFAVLESDAMTAPALRRTAAVGDDLAAPMGPYLAKVREACFRISDADVADLRTGGYGEEEIFELTVAAALGAALRRRDAGMAAFLGES